MIRYFIDCCGGFGFDELPELDQEYKLFTHCPECGSRRVVSDSTDTISDAHTENMMLHGCN